VKRLFGFLIISLSLLFSAALLHLSKISGSGPPNMSILMLVIVFVIGIILIFWSDGKENKENPFVSNEEIEIELERNVNK
jgi:protein-S-isoprenylcysteine O-methyltransferase Ste14